MTSISDTPNREIREMRPDEIDEFVTMMQIAFKNSIEEDRLDEDEIRRLMKKIQSPVYKILTRALGMRMEFYVGIQDGEIASGIQLGIEKDEVYIGNLMTLPDYRRRGFARELLHLSFKVAEEKGVSRVGLGARADNTNAVSLYESEGFETTYHSGRFDFDSFQNITSSIDRNLRIEQVNSIPFKDVDHMLDDCYPAAHLEIKGREKYIKDFVPSRAIRFFARRLAGQTINTYAFYKEGYEKSAGFIQASQSNVEERINLSSPILLEKDNELLIEVIPRIIEIESQIRGMSTASISCSMHREDAVAKIVSLGFKKIRESISMTKYL